MSTNDDAAWHRPKGAAAGPAPVSAPPAGPPPRRDHPPRPEDAAWTRPPGGAKTAAPAPRTREPATGPAPEPAYSGPPPTNPPPANWRPPVVAEPIAPGTLPEQNFERLDVEEQAARTLTTGIGMVVGAILLVLMLVLCARAVF